VGTPKAGVFAEGQAVIVADAIIAQARGGDAGEYSGRGICYIEFGQERVGIVDVTFVPGQAPHGVMQGPSPELVAHKSAFGTSRIVRWFNERVS
jgi:sulfide:quinone oxidoreductase